MHDNTANNPFAPPSSALQESQSNAVPSIEEALARGYDFDIVALIKEAWQMIEGIKGIVIGGLLVYGAVSWVLSIILTSLMGLIFGSGGFVLMLLVSAITSVIAGILVYPMMAGVSMLGIRRAAGQPVSFNEVFNHYGLIIPLFVTGLLMTVLTYLGYFLLFIPGLYLSIAYILAIPLAVERKLSPWQALEASRKAITQHWFKVLGLMLLLGLILIVSAIPLGIGLIWTMPLLIVSIGVLYRTIFGVLPVQS